MMVMVEEGDGGWTKKANKKKTLPNLTLEGVLEGVER
jgi:hypothetical protein